MHSDHKTYLRFAGPQRLERTINTLIGLVEGISMDGFITKEEVALLRSWFNENQILRSRHPFTELMPLVAAALEDGILSEEERDDILWLCQKLVSQDFYDRTTCDLQRLHALLAGVLSDGKITEQELRGLMDWLANHEHLKTCWPYDEVDSIVSSVLADGDVSANEEAILKEFFAEFLACLDNRTISSPPVLEGCTVNGLCAMSPEITIDGAKFCLTGASARYKRDDLESLLRSLGGNVVGSVSASLDYLVIGSEGNPCWAYACYGRKVEKAVLLRKQGARIVIVHERDLHDAIADAR